MRAEAKSSKDRLRLACRIVAILGSASLVFFVFIANMTPFGDQRIYRNNTAELSQLGPSSRVQNTGDGSTQISDLAYFTNIMPHDFDKAVIRMKLKNPYPDQQVALGFRDKAVWHYYKSIVSDPIMDTLSYQPVGDGPYLYQKMQTYADAKSFIAKPPTDKLIGTYDYDSVGLVQNTTLQNYMPAKTDTVITSALRGQVTMYAYLEKEPFKMSITKRDLNWYGDPDVVTAKVYKGMEQVFEATIDDDGNVSSNRKPGQPQEITMQNPGPGLPESGVYKIVIDAPGDTVITHISTNLHKLAFEGPLYVAGNREVYGDIVPATAPTVLTTNALSVTASMDHNQVQTVTAGKSSAKLSAPGAPVTLDTGSGSSVVTVPKSDVVINGVGYFGFSADQFFAPTPYHIIPITSVEDLAKVDYVLTNYVAPKKLDNGWVEVERTFDLSTAVTKKGKLSWVISAPGLADNKRTIEIKDIEMTLSKKGWWAK